MNLKTIRTFQIFIMLGLGLVNAKSNEPTEESTPCTKMLFDLTDKNSHQSWRTSNDNVMGGVSEGGPLSMDGFLRFKGVLSLENNGGFSSIYRDADLDLSDFSGVEMKVKGDGRVYDFRFRTSAKLVGNWYVSYSGKIKTEKDKWITVKVPFDELKQSFRGRQLSGFPFKKDEIKQVRILLGDKKPGPFQLDVEWIRSYKDNL